MRDGTPHPDAAAAARVKLEGLRRTLVDLTARNRLLSFAHRDGGRTQLRVIDELPDQLFERLHAEKKAFVVTPLPAPEDAPEDEASDAFQAALAAGRETDAAFAEEIDGADAERPDAAYKAALRRLKDRVRDRLGMPPWTHGHDMTPSEWARQNDLAPAYDLPHAGDFGAAPKHKDSRLQTLLFQAPLERAATGLIREGRRWREEKGVDALYLALGFLEWRETAESPTTRLAPLLLLPVEITRRPTTTGPRFDLELGAGGVRDNEALRLKLKTDFNLLLPAFDADADPRDEDAPPSTPEAYFVAVAKMAEAMPRWRLRRFATIAPFTFNALAIYQDLAPENWPEGLENEPLIAALLGGRAAEDGGGGPDAEPLLEDRTATPAPLVMDADASQYAIVHKAVIEGRDLAVQGPPGTGKSQTIVNLIAAALSAGERVLFVAEKAAAVAVVAKRLDEVGLGPFCLDLHRTDMPKADVLKALKDRIDLTATPPDLEMLETAQAEAGRLRESLTAYADGINQRFGGLGMTVHEIVWSAELSGADGLPEGVDDIRLEAPESVTPYGADEARAMLRRIAGMDADFREAHGAPERHPWRGLGDRRPRGSERTALLRTAADWAGSLSAIEALEPQWRRFGMDMPAGRQAAEAATAAIAALPAPAPDADLTQFASCIDATVRDAYRAFAAAAEQRAEAAPRVSAPFRNDGDPGGTIGGLDELAAAWESVAGDAPVKVLKALADAKRAQAGDWAALADIATEFIAAVGVERPGGSASAGALRRALQASSLLAPLSPSAVKWTTRLAGEPERTASANAALERRQVLLAGRQEAESETGAAFDALGRSSEVVRDAGLLERAGLFARLFGREHGAAKRRLAAAGLDVRNRRGAATAARRAAEQLREEEAFAEDARARATLGGGFIGMETDFDAIADAARYVEAVREAFDGHDAAAISARSALLESDGQKLTAMRAVAASESRRSLQVLEASLSRFADDAPIKSASAELFEAATSIEGVVRRAEAIGVRPDATPPQLRDAAAAGRAFVEAERAMGAEARFGGVSADVETVRATASLVARVSEALKAAPALFPLAFTSDYATGRADLQAIGLDLAAAITAETVARRRLEDAGFDCAALFPEPPEAVGFQALGREAQAAVDGGEAALDAWLALRRDRAAAAEAGLQSLLDVFDRTGAPLADLADAYDRALYRGLAFAAFAENPALEQHYGADAERLRALFAKLDRNLAKLQAKTIAARLARNRGPAGNAIGPVGARTELALIEHYAAQKRPRVSLRRLFAKAPEAIQALKPCLMASPTTIAETLTPGRMAFDLLVIDEASQMKPEFAAGALARSRQAVIVGDEMQLPPTNFFNRVADGAEDEEQAEDETVTHESILGLANAAFRPEARLLWHYRSRHESLIAFSNQQFYENGLIVFPAAAKASEHGLGVSYRRVEGGGYVSGRSVNPTEAEAIVAITMERMRTAPDRSVGVVAMNRAQRDLIEDMFNQVADADAAVQAYLDRWRGSGLDPFFIKNLENVQGDERDVILISTTYGPDVDTGKVAQRFGPINGAQGHRRLNVLFSRARMETVVISSMAASDVRVDAGSSAGVQALRNFLAYAATGRLPAQSAGGPEAYESPFERHVARLLAEAGFETTPQVGVAGYRIDLGVSHASFPHGYIAGVECDGASYHSAASARDRDRLRQEVLERLGWTIIRVWSTDWFADPAGETRRLVAKLKTAAQNAAAA